MSTTQLSLQFTLSSLKDRNFSSSLYLAYWRNQGTEANFQKFQHPWSPSDTHIHSCLGHTCVCPCPGAVTVLESCRAAPLPRARSNLSVEWLGRVAQALWKFKAVLKFEGAEWVRNLCAEWKRRWLLQNRHQGVWCYKTAQASNGFRDNVML